MHLSIVVPYPSGGPRLLPRTLSAGTVQPLQLFLHLSLVLSLGLGFRVSFSTALAPLMTEKCLRSESTGWWYRHLVRVTFS